MFGGTFSTRVTLRSPPNTFRKPFYTLLLTNEPTQRENRFCVCLFLVNKQSKFPYSAFSLKSFMSCCTLPGSQEWLFVHTLIHITSCDVMLINLLKYIVKPCTTYYTNCMFVLLFTIHKIVLFTIEDNPN